MLKTHYPAVVNPSPFIHIKNNKFVIELLKTRIPYDAQVLNMAFIYEKFPEYMNIYIWNGTDGETDDMNRIGHHTWIVITSIREDFGLDISISMPPATELTEEVKYTFSNSKIFHWDKPHLFVAIPHKLSAIIIEINAHMKGNQISVSPCSLYYVEPKDALEFEISPRNDITVNTLDTNSGSEFIYRNWRYAAEGSSVYMRRFMAVNPSCGIVSKDNCQILSGVVMGNNGLMGMLFTLEKYRNKQFGTLAMHGLMRDLALKGFFPCSTVDEYNNVSKLFHTKIGMKFSHKVDFVKFRKN